MLSIKKHNILKLCYIVAYTDNSNTNLLHTFVNRTYTYTRPRYTFVIAKSGLNISIHAVHFSSIKLWNKLNTMLKLITNIKIFIKKLKMYYIDNY